MIHALLGLVSICGGLEEPFSQLQEFPALTDGGEPFLKTGRMKVRRCRLAPSTRCPKNHDLAIKQIRVVLNIFTIGHLGVCTQDARMSVLLLQDLSMESAT